MRGNWTNLSSDHRSALIDSAKCLAQITRPAHERELELGLIDVELVCISGQVNLASHMLKTAKRTVSGSEHLRLINEVDIKGLQNLHRNTLKMGPLTQHNARLYLCLHEMSNACLGHHGNGHRLRVHMSA